MDLPPLWRAHGLRLWSLSVERRWGSQDGTMAMPWVCPLLPRPLANVLPWRRGPMAYGLLRASNHGLPRKSNQLAQLFFNAMAYELGNCKSYKISCNHMARGDGNIAMGYCKSL